MPFGVNFELVRTGPLLPPGGGPYLRAWNRSATWQGPAQSFGGGTIRPGAEYEVKALLRVAGASCAPLQIAARVRAGVTNNPLSLFVRLYQVKVGLR